jgi:hypothetical protein
MNTNGEIERVGGKEIHDTILMNINEILHNPKKLKNIWIKKKSKKFYRKLYCYVVDHELILDEYNMRRLAKKSGNTFDGEKYRHKLEFADMDGQTKEASIWKKWGKSIKRKFKSNKYTVNGQDYFRAMRRIQSN